MSVRDILQNAKFPETAVEICLRGDLQDEWETLQAQRNAALLQQAREAKEDPNRRLGQRPLAAEPFEGDEILARLQDEMAAATLTLHMRGVSSSEYNLLQSIHKAGRPREGNVTDQNVGFNLEAFYKLVIKRCTFRITAPDGDETTFTADEWNAFLDSITDAQFDQLVAGVQSVNRKAVRVPLGRPKSESPTPSALNSQPQPPSGSVTSDSADGPPNAG